MITPRAPPAHSWRLVDAGSPLEFPSLQTGSSTSWRDAPTTSIHSHRSRRPKQRGSRSRFLTDPEFFPPQETFTQLVVYP